MPIALTTAFDPGAFDEGNTYPKAKIIKIDIDIQAKTAQIFFTYGDDSGGSFVPGQAARRKRVTIQDSGGSTPFTDLVSQATLDGESVYDAVKRVAYSYLQTNDASLAGTVA